MNEENKTSIKWISESIIRDDYSLNAAITKLENGLLFIISSNGYKFGSLSISIPFKFQVDGGGSTSTTIPVTLGTKNELISKALGERISHKTNQMVISIVNIDEKNKNIIKDCIKLIESILDQLK